MAGATAAPSLRPSSNAKGRLQKNDRDLPRTGPCRFIADNSETITGSHLAVPRC